MNIPIPDGLLNTTTGWCKHTYQMRELLPDIISTVLLKEAVIKDRYLM